MSWERVYAPSPVADHLLAHPRAATIGAPMANDPYAPPNADRFPDSGAGRAVDGSVIRVTEQEAAEIQARLRSLNRCSILFLAPGLAVQLAGWLGLAEPLRPWLSLSGLVLMGVGLSYFARTRGRSPWFGTLGLLSILGAAIVGRLPKNCVNCRAAVGSRASCERCGAPVFN